MQTPGSIFTGILKNARPAAIARISGNKAFPALNGTVLFYNTPYDGILIEVQLFSLPDRYTAPYTGFYGFHIHETGNCSNNFSHTGNHYNPADAMHPYHAGDLPLLLGNHGYAYMLFFYRTFFY